MVIGEGDRRKVRVEEIDEYRYLGLIILVRGLIFPMQEQNRVRKTKQQGALVRVFCRGSKNLVWCAKMGWERVVLPSNLYGCDVIPTTMRRAQDLDREQEQMGQFVTGASQT